MQGSLCMPSRATFVPRYYLHRSYRSEAGLMPPPTGCKTGRMGRRCLYNEVSLCSLDKLILTIRIPGRHRSNYISASPTSLVPHFWLIMYCSHCAKRRQSRHIGNDYRSKFCQACRKAGHDSIRYCKFCGQSVGEDNYDCAHHIRGSVCMYLCNSSSDGAERCTY